MKKIAFKLSLITLLFSHSWLAFSDCQDLIVRMKDPAVKDGGREITTLFNCHGGSYFHPGATTIHFYEWKQGHLCQTVRSCGNVRAWRGSFNAGAVWTWGQSITDFTRNISFVNDFTKLADGALPAGGGNGGDGVSVGDGSSANLFINNFGKNTCINNTHSSVKTYGVGGAGVGSAKCYQKSAMSIDQWKNWDTAMKNAGINSSSNVDITAPEVKFICKAGEGGPGIGDYSGNTSIATIQDCQGANAGAFGGPGGIGGNGYAPVFGNTSGSSSDNGSYDTDFNSNSVHLNFAVSFENIKRYCSDPQPEICY